MYRRCHRSDRQRPALQEKERRRGDPGFYLGEGEEVFVGEIDFMIRVISWVGVGNKKDLVEEVVPMFFRRGRSPLMGILVSGMMKNEIDALMIFGKKSLMRGGDDHQQERKFPGGPDPQEKDKKPHGEGADCCLG